MRSSLLLITVSIAMLGCGGGDGSAGQSRWLGTSSVPKRFPIFSASQTLGFIDEKGNLTAQTELTMETNENAIFAQMADVTEDLAARWEDVPKRAEQTFKLFAFSRWAEVGLGQEALKSGRSLNTTGVEWIGATRFSEGRLPLEMAGRWGFLGEDGQFAVNPQYDLALRYAEGLAPVKTGDRWGYIDLSGKMVITPSYDAALPFSGGQAAVYLGDRCGYVDRDGRFTVNPKYAVCLPFFDGVATVVESESGRAGLIGADGEVLIAPQFEAMSEVYGKHAAAQIGERWGLVDRTGKFVVTPQFDAILPPAEGALWLVQLSGRWGFIDVSGEYVIGPTLDAAMPFRGGVARVQVGDRWGFIKTDGTYLGDAGATYDDARDMFNGRAAVMIGDRWGFVDETGAVVVSPAYDAAGNFHGALAPVVQGGALGYIDRSGAVVRVPTGRSALLSGRKERAYLASMKADLRNLVTAEEAFFSDYTTYGTIADLGNYYRSSSGVTITATPDGGRGWEAEARHSGSTRICAIKVGSRVAAGENEGEPVCR